MWSSVSGNLMNVLLQTDQMLIKGVVTIHPNEDIRVCTFKEIHLIAELWQFNETLQINLEVILKVRIYTLLAFTL